MFAGREQQNLRPNLRGRKTFLAPEVAQDCRSGVNESDFEGLLPAALFNGKDTKVCQEIAEAFKALPNAKLLRVIASSFSGQDLPPTRYGSSVAMLNDKTLKRAIDEDWLLAIKMVKGVAAVVTANLKLECEETGTTLKRACPSANCKPERSAKRRKV
ncbi:hypothetical protein C8J56DRAFT_1175006 [Mycena floridula]|nr:hypothetical protein C8J56DRAFT_1175006 [Mycena floridula]